MLGDVLFKGDQAEKRQLERICEIKGSITTENWQEGTQFKYYEMLHPEKHFNNQFKEYFREQMKNNKQECDEDMLSFVESMLEYDPKKRLTAEQALSHPFLQEGVGSISEMP